MVALWASHIDRIRGLIATPTTSATKLPDVQSKRGVPSKYFFRHEDVKPVDHRTGVTADSVETVHKPPDLGAEATAA